MTNSQLNKSKSGIKNGMEVTLKISSNVAGDSNDENNFPYELLLTNIQVLRLHKAFVNNLSINIKLSKTQLHKIGQSGGFLGRLLGTGLPSIGNVLFYFTSKALFIHEKIKVKILYIQVSWHHQMPEHKKIYIYFTE